MVPYREEMAKRHLKVTGDLGRVVFIVRLPHARFQEPVTDVTSGVRSAQHTID